MQKPVETTDELETYDGFIDTSKWKTLCESGLFKTLAEHGHHSNGIRKAMHEMRNLGLTSDDRGITFSAATQLASTIYCLRAFASQGLQEEYLPSAESGTAIGGHAITETGAGSDVMAMDTTAVLAGDHYVLNGTKRLITNSPVASTLIVYAKTLEQDTHKGLSAFLIETDWPGVDKSSALNTAGMKSSPIGEVLLDNVKVPYEHRIGHAGAGLLILDQVMKREILLAFAAHLGEMQKIVEKSILFANTRSQFGTNIGKNQLVANRIVETQIAIELGNSLLERIANNLDDFDDLTIPVLAAKIFISESSVQAALNAIQIHGGSGYLTSSGLPEYLLDAIPGTIYSGSNDMLRTKISDFLGVKR